MVREKASSKPCPQLLTLLMNGYKLDDGSRAINDLSSHLLHFTPPRWHSNVIITQYKVPKASSTQQKEEKE